MEDQQSGSKPSDISVASGSGSVSTATPGGNTSDYGYVRVDENSKSSNKNKKTNNKKKKNNNNNNNKKKASIDINDPNIVSGYDSLCIYERTRDEIRCSLHRICGVWYFVCFTVVVAPVLLSIFYPDYAALIIVLYVIILIIIYWHVYRCGCYDSGIPIAYYVSHKLDAEDDGLYSWQLRKNHRKKNRTYIGKKSQFLYASIQGFDRYTSVNNGPARYSSSFAKVSFYFNNSAIPYVLEQPFKPNVAKNVADKINSKWATAEPVNTVVAVHPAHPAHHPAHPEHPAHVEQLVQEDVNTENVIESTDNGDENVDENVDTNVKTALLTGEKSTKNSQE